MECKEKVKSVKSWSGLQRIDNWSVKRRQMECQEEVNGILGVGGESGTSPCYMKNLKKSLVGLNWDVFWPLSALIMFMVHIPFKTEDIHCHTL